MVHLHLVNQLCVVRLSCRYVRFSQRARAIKGCSLLRLQIFYYCVAVAVFGVVRGLFDTGRLLLAAAAFHNLGEWGYFGHRWLKRVSPCSLLQCLAGGSWMCLWCWLDGRSPADACVICKVQARHAAVDLQRV